MKIFIKWISILFRISLASLLSRMILLTLLLQSGCNDEENGGAPEPDPTQTIYQILQNAPGLDSLARYIQSYPDIISLINSSGNLTLFAPDNSAFENLLSTEGFPNDIRQINAEVIKGVLFYHLLLNGLSDADLVPGSILPTAFPGEFIRINLDGTLKTGSAANAKIELIRKNIRATNGYVHMVGDVLIPPTIGSTLTELTGTVAGTILLYGNYSILANAILKADSSLAPEQIPLMEILRDQEVTLFAPPNEVFKALELETEDLSGSQWREIVRYHILPGTVVISRLLERSYATFQGEKLFNTAGKFINGFPITIPDASPAANGTVHVLAGLLKPGLLNGGDIPGVATFQGFDSLTVALQLTSLTALLSAGNGPYTLFAPSNEAFESFLTFLNFSSLSEIAADKLIAILSHHVIEGIFYSSDFTNGQNLNTLSGIGITVIKDETGISISDGLGEVSQVVNADKTATNGVLHVVGRVLMPE